MLTRGEAKTEMLAASTGGAGALRDSVAKAAAAVKALESEFARMKIPELVERYQLFEPLPWPPGLVAAMLRWTTELRGTPEYDHDWVIARGMVAIGRWSAL